MNEHTAEIDAVLAALHEEVEAMPPGDYRAGWSDALDEIASRTRVIPPGSTEVTA
jgi:hypothetical protein